MLQLILLADRVEVDVAQALDLVAELLDLLGDRVPVHLGRLVAACHLRRPLGVLRGQVQLQLFLRALDQRLHTNAQFANMKL